MSATASSLAFECQIHFHHTRHGRKQMAIGAAPALAVAPPGRVPRITRLMALAIRFERLLKQGDVRDYAELARLGHVTRARVTQIVNLMNLDPSIQEEILFLPPTAAGHDVIKEWQVRPIAAEPRWSRQRKLWNELRGRAAVGNSAA